MLNETEIEIINKKNIIEGFFDLFSKGEFDERKGVKNGALDSIVQIHYDTIIVYQKQYKSPWNFNLTDTSSIIQNKHIHESNMNISDSVIVATKIDTLDEYSVDKNIKVEDDVIIKSRSKLLHTLTSSYALIILLIMLPIIPFTEVKFDWSMMMGIVLFMIITAGLIWLNQYLFGLIPLINNTPWINYTINIIAQTIVGVLVTSALIKAGEEK